MARLRGYTGRHYWTGKLERPGPLPRPLVSSIIGQITKTTDNSYHQYAHVSLNGRLASTALIDSGNSFSTCIDGRLLPELGIRRDELVPIPGVSTVATAKEGAALQVLGRTPRDVTIQFAGTDKFVQCRPAVIQNMAMPINISGPLLKSYNIDQLHSANALLFQQERIPLYARQNVNAKVSSVYTQEKVTVPPYSEMYISVLCPDRRGDTAVAGVIECSEAAVTDTHGLIGFLPTWVSCDNTGCMVAALLNPGEEEVHLPAGTLYGTFFVPPDDWMQVAGLSPPSTGSAEQPPQFCQGKTNAYNVKQRTELLIKQFKLKENPILQADPKLYKAVLTLMLTYFEVLGFDGRIGKAHLAEFNIKLSDPHAVPTRDKYRPVPPHLMSTFEEQMKKWKDQGLVEPINSPWSSNLVPVPKKSGGVRWCVDYRNINKITCVEAGPMPLVADNLAKWSGSRVYSTMDVRGAFSTVPVAEDTKPYLAFATPHGLQPSSV